jgi:hypothetical protein
MATASDAASIAPQIVTTKQSRIRHCERTTSGFQKWKKGPEEKKTSDSPDAQSDSGTD